MRVLYRPREEGDNSPALGGDNSYHASEADVQLARPQGVVARGIGSC